MLSYRKATEMNKRYLLIDDRSENYFVGRIERAPGTMKPEIERLKVGETAWRGHFGLERTR